MPTIINDSNIYDLVDAYLDDKSRLPADLQNVPIGDWDVSRVTDMEGLFNGKVNFDEPLNDWNVINVKNMRSMFFEAENFNQPLNKWHVTNVENMGSMFSYCEKFNQPLRKWNVSKVENMRQMFMGCSQFNQSLSKWKIRPDVNIADMFLYCPITDANKPEVEVKTIVKPKRLNIENKFKTIPIKKELYDPVMMESMDIHAFINESKDNIVFVYNDHYFPVNKNAIKIQMENPSNVIYECIAADTLDAANINVDKKYLNCKSIGLYVDFIDIQIMKSILFSNHQIYELVKTDKQFVSTVSHSVLFDAGSFVGAAHCQSGKGGVVYDVVKVHKGPKKSRMVIPSLTKTRKSRKSKSKSKTRISRSL